MTAKYMKGTSMEALEAEMQRIPGFGPRKSGVIRSRYSLRDLKGANCQWEVKKTATVEEDEAFYQVLLHRFAAELPEGTFLVRVMKLQNRSGAEQRFFRNKEHRRRFLLLLRCGLFPGLRTDPGFAAAMFLLSFDVGLWEQAVPHVSEWGIDYKAFHVQGVDLDGYAIFCAAKELGTGKPYLKLSELGDAELIHDGLLLLILHSILISRHGIGIIYEEEKETC
ncbi:hypothetical protein [Hungatella effluvii]|uniref:hypothetical protein n=1 Tax=Hungatella effluvii TaxID=1096246 RepID=UPI0022E1A260|nr:hypothetical protein [Hungatella effluvii]